MDATILTSLFGALFSVLWWLLVNKDAKQQKELEDLKAQHVADMRVMWEKHDADVKALADHKLQIASDHYPKRELDQKFEVMTNAMDRGFERLGSKFDKLTDALLNHISKGS
jgi:Skp family chaperone for outer membrane proteins